MEKPLPSTQDQPDYDVIILGAGPAGLQAAIHAARKKTKVLVLGRPESSSLFRAHIENYMGVAGVAGGEELLTVGVEQALKSGAEIKVEDAVATGMEGELFTVISEDGTARTAHALVIATGVSRKGLGIPREKELVGRGISYCVDCDANFYRGAVVAVVGSGSAAVHGAVTLSKIAKEVTLYAKDLVVSDSLRKELEGANIALVTGRKIRELKGDQALTGIVLDDGTEKALDGLFIERGAKGAMQLAAFLGVTLDPERMTFIVTDRSQATNIPGIFAAGDICGPPFQMAKAVGEGCVAGLSAGTYALRKKRGGNGSETDS